MRILTMGDSIMQYNDCTTYPLTGWVQMLDRFLKPGIEILNFARNGRSTKSFIDEGRFDRVRAEAEPGDIVLIQFGHNDEKSNDPTRYTDPDGLFRKNLQYFVTELRNAGARPILLTPVARRKFSDDGTLEDTHGKYPEAVKTVAEICHVPCIDMTALSMAAIQRLGVEDSSLLFMNLPPHLYPNYPQGKSDNSHLRPDGAFLVSRLAATEFSRLDSDWPEYTDFANAVIVFAVDREALDKEIQDEKQMA
ncbi:MAG: rhamnogalacturonan acetylesterase [Treponema sp.]|nr:rhamnogalacturonan acetylesterase [Treponema sp.]